MPKPQHRDLAVIRTELISPNMRRLTVGGTHLEGFPENQESAYVKLLFPSGAEKPIMRTYTIRNHRPYCNELDIDFMLHGDSGPASRWAATAQVGDRIQIAGPGGLKLIDFTADWFFMAGDMTSLPAISVNMERMPSNAAGYVVIEVLDERDIQELKAPPGIDLRWVVNPQPGIASGVLVDAVTALPWLAGRPSIWAACEFESMRLLRRYFKYERSVGKPNLYVSSYWKHGVSEDRHKSIKSQDAKTEESVNIQAS